MKDRTDSMNADHGGEGAVNGYTDPGKPELTNAAHKRRMEQGGLADNEALAKGGKGYDVGGFLRRANYGDRR